MKPILSENTLSEIDRQVLKGFRDLWSSGQKEKVIDYIKTKLHDREEKLALYSTFFGNEIEEEKKLKEKFCEICETPELNEFWLAKAQILRLRAQKNLSPFKLFMGDYLVCEAETTCTQTQEKLPWYQLATTQYQSIRAFYLLVHWRIQEMLQPKSSISLSDRISVLLQTCDEMIQVYPAAGRILKAIAGFYIVQKLCTTQKYDIALQYFEIIKFNLKIFFQSMVLEESRRLIANVCGAEEGQEPLQSFAALYAELGLWKAKGTGKVAESFAELVSEAVGVAEENVRQARLQFLAASCRM